MKKYNEYLSRIAMVKIHAESSKEARTLTFTRFIDYSQGVDRIRNGAMKDVSLDENERGVIKYLAGQAIRDINLLYHKE